MSAITQLDIGNNEITTQVGHEQVVADMHRMQSAHEDQLQEGQQQTATTRARTAALVAEIASGRAEGISDCCLEILTAAIQVREAEEYLETTIEQSQRSLAYFSRGGIFDGYKDEWR